jgi:hypothetical protein
MSDAIEPGQQSEKCAFATPARTNDGKQFAIRNVDI